MKTAVIVGQNHPDSTLARLVDTFDRVIIFEPLPDAADACRYAYKDCASVIVFQAACGESFGPATFHQYNIRGLSSSLGTMTGEAQEVYSSFDLSLTGTVDVQVLHLGFMLQLLGVVSIDFLMIDAQGMDFAILKTVEPWIAGSRVGIIQLEADGNGFKHYDGLPDNSEASIIKWMSQFPQYELSRIADRMPEQPDLVFELKVLDTLPITR